MSVVRIRMAFPGRISDAERVWYDPYRWPSWVDGFGSVTRIEGDWPEAGARSVWASTPNGRGRVVERVTAFEPRAGQTVAVEDERITGTQTVSFAAKGDDVQVELALDYALKGANALTFLTDKLFIRRAFAESLRRTLLAFGNELRAEHEADG